MLICDSRERKNSHILAYFDQHKIEHEVKKLDVGDYMIENGNISVDTKRSIDELSQNLTNKADKERFLREIRKAFNSGIQLVVLIESNKYHDVSDLRTWKSKYSKVRGCALVKAIYKLQISYGVRFEFAPKISTARRILEILEVLQNAA